jgi:hypothetical protein
MNNLARSKLASRLAGHLYLRVNQTLSSSHWTIKIWCLCLGWFRSYLQMTRTMWCKSRWKRFGLSQTERVNHHVVAISDSFSGCKGGSTRCWAALSIFERPHWTWKVCTWQFFWISGLPTLSDFSAYKYWVSTYTCTCKCHHYTR